MLLKLIDQVLKWKEISKNDKISWSELELWAKQIDSQNEIEIRKVIVLEQNSKPFLAERIADLKGIIDECDKCLDFKNKEIVKAIEMYKKTGSVKEQFERGETFIINNPSQYYNDIKNEAIMIACKEHRSTLRKITELNKIINT